MPEEVTIDRGLQLIHVKSSGDITSEDFKETLDAILKIREVEGLVKVFVDATTVASYPSTISIFEFGSEAAETLKGIQLAIVVSSESRDDSQFFETVTRNRGARVRAFDSRDAALAWLTKEPDKSAGGDA